jgi:agmatinase
MSTPDLKKLEDFDPNDVGLASNQIFGLPLSEEESKIILVPAPWDTTVSYRAGTKEGPAAILEASYQVDLHDQDFPGGWKQGFAMQEIPSEWAQISGQLRPKAERYISFLSEGGELSSDQAMREIRDEINAACAKFRQEMKSRTSTLLKAGKLVGLVGGDHSTPLGFIDALSEIHDSFCILQIDAHCDLRDAYEGFTYSHASIMWNALTIPQVKKLVQVGIRDFCEAEANVISGSKGRVKTYFDASLKADLYAGHSWKSICTRIVNDLPEKVYLSFDIDGLDPKLCPHTGTPVPGGLEFEQAVYLIREVVSSGRKLIGFDLNEVSPGETEWDANVGARMLYKLCNFLLLSHSK